MFARPHAVHSQIAYVTNDLEAAAALIQTRYGAAGFFTFSNDQPGLAAMGGARLKIGLTRIGGIEIELIEPIGDTAPLFADALTGSPAVELRFHHICSRVVGSIDDWHAHEASIDPDAHPIVFRGGLGEDMRFFYTDERGTLGHYVEHVWMSPAMLAKVLAATPTYPSPEVRS